MGDFVHPLRETRNQVFDGVTHTSIVRQPVNQRQPVNLAAVRSALGWQVTGAYRLIASVRPRRLLSPEVRSAEPERADPDQLIHRPGRHLTLAALAPPDQQPVKTGDPLRDIGAGSRRPLGVPRGGATPCGAMLIVSKTQRTVSAVSRCRTVDREGPRSRTR